jgi:hypothetical protein
MGNRKWCDGMAWLGTGGRGRTGAGAGGTGRCLANGAEVGGRRMQCGAAQARTIRGVPLDNNIEHMFFRVKRDGWGDWVWVGGWGMESWGEIPP